MNAAAVLNHLWQSTEFAGIAALVALALRKNAARVRFGVWLAASLKFLVPFGALAALGSSLPWAHGAAAWRVAGVAAVAAHFETVVIPITVDALPQPTGVPWGWILASLWLAGSAALAVRWMIQWRRTARLVRSAEPRTADGVRLRVTAAAVEPGVFGVFRPVLLVPERIEGRLTPEQYAAVLVHERCHLARRDNLWAALHRVVETVFWFHPFVWWIGARMLAERERACDEAVLRAGGDARAYAGGILGVCRHYMDSRLSCSSGVLGGPLQRRVGQILNGGWGRRMSRKGCVILAGLGAAALLVPVAAGYAVPAASMAMQLPHASLRGEVVSVRPADANARTWRMQFPPGGRFTGENIPLKNAIAFAYGVTMNHLGKVPHGMGDKRFTIEIAPAVVSRPPVGAPVESATVRVNRMKQVMQAVLADRFHLRVHWEKRTAKVYLLAVSKGGPKMKPASADEVKALLSSGDTPVNTAYTGPGLLVEKVAQPSALAAALTHYLGKDVVDDTGLTGRYDFSLRWIPPSTGASGPTLPPAGPDAPAPSLAAALKEQAGLDLRPGKSAERILIIDHVQAPDKN